MWICCFCLQGLSAFMVTWMSALQARCRWWRRLSVRGERKIIVVSVIEQLQTIVSLHNTIHSTSKHSLLRVYLNWYLNQRQTCDIWPKCFTKLWSSFNHETVQVVWRCRRSGTRLGAGNPIKGVILALFLLPIRVLLQYSALAASKTEKTG